MIHNRVNGSTTQPECDLKQCTLYKTTEFGIFSNSILISILPKELFRMDTSAYNTTSFPVNEFGDLHKKKSFYPYPIAIHQGQHLQCIPTAESNLVDIKCRQ